MRKPASPAGFLYFGARVAKGPSDTSRVAGMALWIAIGVGIGAALGATVFDNVAIGIAIGIPIGLAGWLATSRK